MRVGKVGKETAKRTGEDGEFPRSLRLGFWISALIALAAVARRTAALVSPPQGLPPALATLDAAFASHRGLTLAHILPAAAFVLLAPFVLSGNLGTRPRVERTFFALGLCVGLTAYVMSRQAVGGWLEQSATLLFNSLFLLSLGKAFLLWQRAEMAGTRRWLVRATAILLGIATTRPIMGFFFATTWLTHLTPQQFFGIAFWIGFSLNTVFIEWWLRQRASQIQRLTGV